MASPPWLDTIAVIMIPCCTWTLGAVIFLCISGFSKTLLAAFQNLSAGVLVAAVGNELFPLMRCGASGVHPPTEGDSYLGLVLGMAVGCGFMFGLDTVLDGLTGEEEGEEEEEEGKSQANEETPLKSEATKDADVEENFPSKMARYKENMAELDRLADDLETKAKAGTRNEVDKAVHAVQTQVECCVRHLRSENTVTEKERMKIKKYTAVAVAKIRTTKASSTKEALAGLRQIEEVVEDLHKRTDAPKKRMSRFNNPLVTMPKEELPEPTEVIPWAQVAAICIDGLVDGLLIGLSYSASTKAGLSMAIATCIEMGFLGLSFSATIKASTQSHCKHITIAMLPGILMFAGAMAGRGLGAELESSQELFIGFISFAMVALMYLVTQELLTEARETLGESLINIMFFVGILGGIVLDKALE